MGSDHELALNFRTTTPARRSWLVWAARLCGYSLIVIFALEYLYSPYQRHVLNISKSSGLPSRTGFVRGRIDWEPCLDNDKTYCTYLEVPMDYTNTSSGRTMSLFMRMLPAFPNSSSEYLGPLLINPGGPGASGNVDVLGFGSDLHDLLQGRYDIIGFDPRGVNMTTPPLPCLAGATPAQGAHAQEALQHLGIHYEARHAVSSSSSLNISMLVSEAERAFARRFDAFHASIAGSCRVENEGGEILEHIGTVATARDMVFILEALGERKRGLNYYGKSYGTVLGSTFAALYPDDVNRVVLDGVADATHYFRDFLEYGRIGMSDTHKTAHGFFASCAEAGPERCALSSESRPNASTIEQRIERLYLSTAQNPIAVPGSSVGSGILTASDLKLFFFTRMYNPKTWPELARGLAEAERGNGTRVFSDLYSWFVSSHAANYTVNNPYGKHMGSNFLSTMAIMCGDTHLEFDGKEGYLEYMHELGAMSPIGENWSHWQSFCRFYSPRAKEVYEGEWRRGSDLRKTRFPLLYVSQTGDPVTSLPSAQRAVQAFGNDSATLLIQNGLGHCSHAHPSLCTARHIRAYFLEGKVPPAETVCEVEPGFLFPETSYAGTKEGYLGSRSAEDERILRILERMSDRTRLS